MNRFLSAFKNDVIIQFRNSLYTIGIVVGVLVAVALSQLARPEHLPLAVPTLMILVVGGSTLMYVAGMIVFERDEGTIHAMIVSPLRLSEYLWSKVLSLVLLATLESLVMIGGAMLLMIRTAVVPLPNIFLLLLGIVALGIVYTLVGVILIVRYNKITDFLIPMAGVAVLLQLPFFYFLGLVQLPVLLLIPTSAPAMLIFGAYQPLVAWQWLYAIGYSLLLIAGLTIWAQRAFQKHVVLQLG